MESNKKATTSRVPSSKGSQAAKKPRTSQKTSKASTLIRKVANKLSSSGNKSRAKTPVRARKGDNKQGNTTSLPTTSGKSSKTSQKSRKRKNPKIATNTAPPLPTNTADFFFKMEPQKEEPQAFFDRTIDRGCVELIEEYQRLRSFIPNDLNYETSKLHPEKNRYKDVVCNEKTRVILKIEPPFTSDYIHANFVPTDSTAEKFVCTQAPNALTAVDFWRLVWQENVPHIIMLCCVVEAGKQKCHQYWPILADQQLNFGPFTISNKCLMPRIDEKKKDEEKSMENVVSMRLTLTKENEPGERQIIHHQWTSWPDKSVPSDARMAAYLLDAVNGSQHVVIHCSAGIGRTGTLAALDICMERLESKIQLDVPEVIKKVRTARMYSVQTNMQYVFLHMVLLERCILKGWVKLGAAQSSKSKYDEMVAEYAEMVAMEQAERPETAVPPPQPIPIPASISGERPPDVGYNASEPSTPPPPIDRALLQRTYAGERVVIPLPDESIPCQRRASYPPSATDGDLPQ